MPQRDRERVLGPGWRTSKDLVWTLSGDATGLHLLTAAASRGYAWRTVATLSEPGFDTDRWIGNGCLTGSGRRVVVAYAPRAFENDNTLVRRGAFVAVVDLADGSVRKLAETASLAYFDPGCGAGETAVITQEGDAGATRLLRVDAARGRVSTRTVVTGQVTSAVPVLGSVVAARGGALIRVNAKGRATRLARAGSTPFRLTPDARGGVVYLDRSGKQARVRRWSGHRTQTLARGAWGRVGVAAGLRGSVFLAGDLTSVRPLPAHVSRLRIPSEAIPSTRGRIAITEVETGDPRSLVADTPRPVSISGVAVSTAEPLNFSVVVNRPSTPGTVAARRASPARRSAAGVHTDAVGSPTSPVDADRTCAVPRNDAKSQVYQPTARQVEWAADQAVVGGLKVNRPANWKQSGLPAYTPQGLFPSTALAGGGRVNVQILLGILAQESNLWQASNHALSGEFGNPLVGNFYGRAIYDTDPGNDWTIDWSKADCGYGVAQVTDGMRLGSTVWTATQQRAIAMDYAANLSAGLQILQKKWNDTYKAGLRVNDGDPQWIENWFVAVWAYNSGFYPNKGDGSAWGVGWLNNPVNPRYPPDRLPFLEASYDDARTPQKWPYPEKVLGWAGHPIDTVDGAGFRAAWWNDVSYRLTVQPPVTKFCDASNTCYPGKSYTPNGPSVAGEPAGPCAHKNAAGQYDLLCYYHQAVTWKSNCSLTCGHELLRFDTTYPEQPDGTHYAPNCSTSGLPSGALIVDDVTASMVAPRAGCGHPFTDAGSFALSFGADAAKKFPSKVDFHQIGGGFGGHFWFAHTRNSSADPGGALRVTGTWTLGRSLNQWARVLVHLPDHGAQTRQAFYNVSLGNGKSEKRNILQRTQANGWVPLGAFAFAGVPKVSLSTNAGDGDGSEDIAWDAIAFQPLSAKPKSFVVSMGDSYSSGEGASADGGVDYYKESDVDGDGGAWRDACHRSRYAWPRKAVLKDQLTTSIGSRADRWDPALDFAFLACSGAETQNLLPANGSVKNAFGRLGTTEYHELPQVDRGFLDANTTLVTLSIGGNDARFADIVKQCIYASGLSQCQNSTLSGDTEPLKTAEPKRIAGPVRSSIITVLSYVHKLAPNAKIVLMGYPVLLERNGQCIPGIGTSEAPWINSTTNEMAQQMSSAAVAATAAGVPTTFSDPRAKFAGQGICGDPETINGIVLSKTPGDESGLLSPSNQSFHPKTTGTTHYADSLNATLRGMGL